VASIVIATFGSLGDLHPKIAVGLELKRRGHDVTIAAMEFYREKIEMIGLGFKPMAPHMNPDDRDRVRELVDARTGTENLLRGIIMPNLRSMYHDLLYAVRDADLLLTGEVVYAAKSVVEATGIKWVTTTLAPISLFSSYDPVIPPMADWYENFYSLPWWVHSSVFALARFSVRGWLGPYKEFRRELGLNPEHDPIFSGKYSNLLHLVMFSKVLGKPQPDWPSTSLQTGFCFYDEQDMGTMPEGLEDFLESGKPPIVFTLGSAAVMDARDFFDQSVMAAKILDRRAVLVYGIFNESPRGLTDDIIAVPYAPYSRLFPRAACVVHQGGVGTTGQVLRAGVPHLIMPFAHDQPDNAARCRRAGVAEVIDRDKYNGASAATALGKILETNRYYQKAQEAAQIVASEHGTKIACDAIECILAK
jgi:UDP:flavonoid glycosyltransferase YjiC (YdhE family)